MRMMECVILGSGTVLFLTCLLGRLQGRISGRKRRMIPILFWLLIGNSFLFETSDLVFDWQALSFRASLGTMDLVRLILLAEFLFSKILLDTEEKISLLRVADICLLIAWGGYLLFAGEVSNLFRILMGVLLLTTSGWSWFRMYYLDAEEG